MAGHNDERYVPDKKAPELLLIQMSGQLTIPARELDAEHTVNMIWVWWWFAQRFDQRF
mgnify:CR=1 FL=1